MTLQTLGRAKRKPSVNLRLTLLILRLAKYYISTLCVMLHLLNYMYIFDIKKGFLHYRFLIGKAIL